MKTLSAAALVILVGGCANMQPRRTPLERARYDAAHRPRRLVFNNDGDDHIQAKAPTVEAFLEVRSTPLVGSQVDTIVYCTSRPFGMFTHNTRVGQVLDIDTFPPDRHNIVPDLIAKGTDPLHVMSEFCRENGFEIIWSMRMNDTHDAGHSPENPHYYFSDFKRTHPECLLGTRDERPRIGAWNAVNYECQAVRDFAYRVFEEICLNYDVDGIELDFFRHLVFFPSVAAGGAADSRERNLMTGLIRRTRQMMDRVSRRKQHPLLLTVRIPDSVPLCRDMGLDVQRWLQEDLVDVVVAGGDFRVNAWEESIELGRTYDVPVWCDLDPSPRYGGTGRFPRNDIRVTRARAAAAWEAGAAAIYYFNWFDPTHPLWHETGTPETLMNMPKWYLANATGTAGYLRPESALLHGADYDRRDQPHPAAPREIPAGESLGVPMELGPERPDARCTLHVLATGPLGRIDFNGMSLTHAPGSPTHGQWTEVDLPADILRPGVNICTLSAGEAAQTSDDRSWDVDVEAAEFADESAAGLPFNIGRTTPRTHTEMRDGGLLIADEGIERGDYVYCSHGWNASSDAPRRAEFEVTVLSGKNGIILADGVSEERFWLHPDKIQAEFAGVTAEVDLTDGPHTVAISIDEGTLTVDIDGETVMSSNKGLSYPAVNGRNVLLFGASTSTTTGKAVWYAVRYAAGGGGNRVYDVVLSVTPIGTSDTEADVSQ